MGQLPAGSRRDSNRPSPARGDIQHGVPAALALAVGVFLIAVLGRPSHAGPRDKSDAGTTWRGSGSVFPFTICGDQFYRGDAPVFLHILSYQPLEPCQELSEEIRGQRICDDLRRFQAYQRGSDPVVLRVYPGPTAGLPMRMPQCFYDGVRELGLWIVRDIYLPVNCDVVAGQEAVDAVLTEVESAGALDLVFAWEFGNEYTCNDCPDVSGFLQAMATYLKTRLAEPGHEEFSDWVTWAAWPPTDPLFTEPSGCPIHVAGLDYYSYNAYSYWPERIRDHPGGAATGTPFAEYLAALKGKFPDKPLVVSETGLADSPSPGTPEQTLLKSWYPIYRYGGLSDLQVAEGLADRYWDVRLVGAAGVAFFEWNDEWHKAGAPCVHNDHPEEYFGLLSFDLQQPGVATTPRFELGQEIVRELFTLRFGAVAPSVTLWSGSTIIGKDESTSIHAEVQGAVAPVRFCWETSRGYIVGESNEVEFYAGGRALGPARITAVVIDQAGRAAMASTDITITTAQPPFLEFLTLGAGSLLQARASGRIRDADLTAHKIILYIQTDALYIQPYAKMNSIWVQANGYWWTQVENSYCGTAVAWLVPQSFDPRPVARLGWSPPGAVASARLWFANDVDNDLLPDGWENAYLGTRAYGRYDDPDVDLADNLEELLNCTNPNSPDNDADADGLPDTWEQLFFGTLRCGSADDPDEDGWDNAAELARGTHPGRGAADRDLDGLPDQWEMRWFGDLGHSAQDDPNQDGFANGDAYGFGLSPLLSGDFGGDGHVEMHDFGILVACFRGPEVPYDPSNLPECCALPANPCGVISADGDADHDVDVADFAWFQTVFTGSGD
jgi:hypothetical protein